MSDGDREPKRIGVDIGSIGKGGARPSHGDCPGALLLINRRDYDELVGGGEVFATPRRDMPVDGRADARIHCTNQVMRKASSMGGEVVYGLCASCSGLEANLRQTLRERQGQQR